MGWESLAGNIGGGILGGILGAQGDRAGQNQTSDYTQNINLKDFEELNKGRSGLEAATYNQQLSGFNELQKLLGIGPGAGEVQANTQFQNQYASQLQNLLNQAANPNQQQNFETARQYFAPQQTALNQQFEQQNIQSNRLAARLGRAGNDPILRNKLAQEQTRQQTMLNSQIGAFGQQLPAFQAQQLMGIGNQLSNIRAGLATQAFQNRQALIGMGQNLTAAERQYRLQAAGRTGSQTSTGSSSSGGGVGDMLGGVISGIGQFGGGFGKGLTGLFGTAAGGLTSVGAGAGAAGAGVSWPAAEAGTAAAVAL